MQELFELLAEYNAQTNREMLGILEAQPAELASRQTGAYYGSILGTLNHVALADLTWLRRLARQFPELGFVGPALPVYKAQGLKDVVWDNLTVFRPVREGLDELLRRLARELPPARYPEVLEYRNLRGQEQRKITWRALLHMFNHQTHHRGQVAALLDQAGVQNDYSNLIWRF
jgi:uncharacterized damage-inducible protein DinB